MAGRQEFETIVASAAKKKLVSFTSSLSTSLASIGTEIVRFYAPTNTIVRIIGAYMKFPAPAGAASGNHTVYVGFDNPTIDTFSGASLFGSDIVYTASMFTLANSSKNPDTTEAMITAFNNIAFDNLNPFRILYVNNTNVAQLGTRDIRVWGIAETVG